MATTQNEKVRVLQRKLYIASKQQEDHRFYSLYDKVYRTDVLMEAYWQCKANKGAPGVDGVTFKDIEIQGLETWLEEISELLRNHAYTPQPVKRVTIPKADGGLRPLGIPTIRDRVIQAACKIVIEPIFEAHLNDNSYGYRPNRGAVDAVNQIERHIRQGYVHVYDGDLKGYFDRRLSQRSSKSLTPDTWNILRQKGLEFFVVTKARAAKGVV